jgi:hypothetical protein
MGLSLQGVPQIIEMCNVRSVIHMYGHMFGSIVTNGSGVDYVRMRTHGIEGHDFNLL